MQKSIINVLKDTSIYTLGGFLSKIISFIVVIFYTHLIDPMDMGAFGYISVIFGVLNCFVVLGGDNAYARYYFEYKELEEKKVLTTTWFSFLFIWSLISIIIPLFFYKQISFFLFETNKYDLAFITALLILPIQLLSTLLNQALRNQFKVKLYTIFNLLNTILGILISIFLLVYPKLGIASLFLGSLFGISFLLPFKIYAIKNLITLKLDLSILKNLLKYGLPFVPASISYWIFSSTDRIMLEYMTSLKSVGIYTIAANFSSILAILSFSIGEAWTPHAVNIYETDKEKARFIFSEFFSIIIFICGSFLFFTGILGKEFFLLFINEKYHTSFLPMMILMIGISFQVTTQVTACGISLSKKTKYFMYITFGVSMLNIGLNYILIPNYAEIGCSIATAISYLVLTLIYYNISQKFFRINYNFKMIIIFIILIILSLIVIDFNIIVKIIFLLFYFLFTYFCVYKYKIIRF